MKDRDSKKAEKAERLAAQLRANLKRRKQQSRAARGGKGDQREEGIQALSNDSESASPSK